MERRAFISLAGGAALASGSARAAQIVPFLATGDFELIGNWSFGYSRMDGTVHDMGELAKPFRFRYIYEDGQLDGLDTYWSRHRNYPEGDPRSLHVFLPNALVLKGRVPPGGGLYTGGLESGMLRALLPVTPGMYIEMRAKLARGLGVWPAFWLNPGVETPDKKFSGLQWPPEIDIFEAYVWQGRTRPRILEAGVHPGKEQEALGPVRDIFSLMQHGRYDPGVDFSEDFHVFGFDWLRDKPIWVVDGRPIKQTTIRWAETPAHILITNQIGMNLKSVDLTGMQANEADWDYTIDYLRVWRRF